MAAKNGGDRPRDPTDDTKSRIKIRLEDLEQRENDLSKVVKRWIWIAPVIAALVGGGFSAASVLAGKANTVVVESHEKRITSMEVNAERDRQAAKEERRHIRVTLKDFGKQIWEIAGSTRARKVMPPPVADDDDDEEIKSR